MTTMKSPDYKAFAKWCIAEASWQGYDLDAAAIQEMAVKHGIIKEVPYNPEVHGDSDCDLEPGDPWYVFVEP